jgi:uncharacterized membrane protein YhaH (DUF805 family)
MGGLSKYLSFQGRARRARFWLTAIAIYGAILVSALLAMGLSGILPFLGILFLPVFALSIVASLANATRRLHDRNKSAWWLLLFVGVPAILLAPGEAARMTPGSESAGFAGLCALISLPFSIWGFVEMGCLRGTTGANRFGDDPLRPATAEAFA